MFREDLGKRHTVAGAQVCKSHVLMPGSASRMWTPCVCRVMSRDFEDFLPNAALRMDRCSHSGARTIANNGATSLSATATHSVKFVYLAATRKMQARLVVACSIPDRDKVSFLGLH